MDLNKRKYKLLMERLDKTAETKPLLWLPCVTLLAAISGTKRLVNDVEAVLSRQEEAGPAVSCPAVISDKPAYVRALSAFLAAAMMITFTPGLNGIAVTNAFAEENGTLTEEDQDNEADDDTETEAQNTPSAPTASTSKSKKDINITLNCSLRGMTSGNAHASINKSYLDNSADVWLISSDAARKDAEAVMIQLGANAAYYVCYPFEINIYDSDSKELITSLEDGSASFEMPVPKIMSTCADKIKVYHVVDGHPDFVESEIGGEDGAQSVKFSASKFSTYIFVAPSPTKDTSPSGSTQNTAPAPSEDISSAEADMENTAPAPSEDISSADAEEDNTAPAQSEEDTPSADANEYEAVPYSDEDYYGSSGGEDVSSAAGTYASSVPVETAAMPSANGMPAPVGEAPERLRLSTKKRRYRIVRKRRLDDLVFVL